MSRIKSTFDTLRARNERAFMPFVTFGDPNQAVTRDLLLAYVDAGADIIEIGIPFTDPLADGPTIQRASERALAGGASMENALEMIADIRDDVDVPLVPMTYVNPVYQIGYEKFAKLCHEAGADAVIISDLPPEEGAEWGAAADAAGVGTIYLMAPTSDDERVESVAKSTTGFIYAVARMGVTGARSDVPPEVGDLVTRIRQHSDTPVCAGFGFSNPDQIRRTCESTAVDGIIVASALIDAFENASGTAADRIYVAAELVKELKAATKP